MPRPGWQGDLKNPCYDVETKTDCPKRHGGCQLVCSEWDNYVKKRNKKYENDFAQREIDYAIYDCISKRNKKIKKKTQKW